ncbi:unnamed protein product, partial [marine sediment metagenome]
YTGLRLGAVTYRGPSRWQYRFDASPSRRRSYVLSEDLDYFRRLRDFRVLDEGRIDPEAERARELERSILDKVRGEVIERLEQVTASEPRPSSHRQGGRPAGRGFGARLDCLMNCGGLEAYYGSAEAAYDAIHRYYRGNPPVGEDVPPRERFASVRSYAKRKREGAVIPCLWYRHPESVPPQLVPG